MIQAIAKKCITFMQKEAVLCVAILCAVVSFFFSPPSKEVFSYIDWDTLALLFSLMAVMKGFQKAGLFVYLGNGLLKRTKTSRAMLLVLVFLPFVLSMVITNDVSLITFVPFGLIVLRMAKLEQLAVPLVVLQTVAANLGSMLTPMGNPQNLYLYAKSGMGFFELCGLMFPYVLFSGVCLAALVLVRKFSVVESVSVSSQWKGLKSISVYLFGFGLCLLGLFGVIPSLAIALVTGIFLFFFDRKLLLSLDYSLLGTFLAFFVFIGNVASIEGFTRFLSSLLEGHVETVAILASQIISNVPAALLLSGFTTQWDGLLIGCNLGGLGTLIASMASLISYKMIAVEYPKQRKRYFFWFTVCNIALLGALILLHLVISR